MPKRSDQGFTFIVLLVGIALVAIVLLFVKSKPNDYKVEDNFSEPESEVQIQQDTRESFQLESKKYHFAENGVYINNQFGFKFSYPAEIFKYYKGHFRIEDNIVVSTSGNLDDTPEYEYPENYWMSFGAKLADTTESFYYYYNRQIDIPVFTDDEAKNRQLINNEKTVKKFTVGEYPGFITYSYPTHYGEGYEPSYGNTVYILKDNVEFSLALFSPITTDHLKDEREKILDSIIESFEFFEPETPTN